MSEIKEIKEKLDPNSPEGLTEYLEKWEKHHLSKIDVKRATVEFGMIDAVLRKIGERHAHRQSAAMQNKCSNCGGPLGIHGPIDTIPIPAPEVIGGWINQFACRAKCAEALRFKAQKASSKLQAEA